MLAHQSITREGHGPLLGKFATHLITVGPPGAAWAVKPAADFETISEALDVIPAMPTDFSAIRYTILVAPGHYRERIRMKPSVNLVGISKESVYIEPWAPSDSTMTDPKDPKHILRPNTEDAVIELASMTNITNLCILNPQWATSKNSAIRGRDVRGFGLSNIDVFPASLWPDNPYFRDPRFKEEKKKNPAIPDFCRGKILELTGNWGTCVITALGLTYLGPDSFGVWLEGVGQNADCHFIQCFFDALFVETETSGAVRIRNCFEVHIRNSILRVNNMDQVAEVPGGFTATHEREVLGAAVDVDGDHVERQIDTNVFIEGSSLECPRPKELHSRRLLHIGPNSDCYFKHSSTDSIMLSGGRFHCGDIPAKVPGADVNGVG